MKELIIRNINEIDLVNDFIFEILKKNRILCFDAPMGAGKTTIIKSVCREMGVNDSVSSPSFSIVNEYKSSNYGKIYHFDFYRIENVKEIFDIGFEEYLDENCIVFIEWPQIAEHLLPKHVKIKIDVLHDNSRLLSVVD